MLKGVFEMDKSFGKIIPDPSHLALASPSADLTTVLLQACEILRPYPSPFLFLGLLESRLHFSAVGAICLSVFCHIHCSKHLTAVA